MSTPLRYPGRGCRCAPALKPTDRQRDIISFVRLDHPPPTLETVTGHMCRASPCDRCPYNVTHTDSETTQPQRFGALKRAIKPGAISSQKQSFTPTGRTRNGRAHAHAGPTPTRTFTGCTSAIHSELTDAHTPTDRQTTQRSQVHNGPARSRTSKPGVTQRGRLTPCNPR